MSEKLKPCPFCGSVVKVNATNIREQIYCPNCGATTVWTSFPLSRKRWNERTRTETGLKPCPFCGSRAKIYQAYDNNFCIQCPKCTVTSHYYKSKEEAVEAWNRRVGDD